MIEKLKRLPQVLYDVVELSISSLEDYLLKFKVIVTKEDYVGRHLGICNSSEIHMIFKSCIAGGYTGNVNIKLFASSKCKDYEEAAEQILEHEVLHQVLNRVVGFEAKKKLDNIHQSFYALDVRNQKWQYTIEFIRKKPNGHVEFV